MIYEGRGKFGLKRSPFREESSLYDKYLNMGKNIHKAY